MLLKHFGILVLSATILLNSCESENADTTTVGNRGTLTGRVELYDSEGSYVSDKQGVAVSIEGTNIRTTTTADGKWVINSLPEGIYDLTFEKPGYGHIKVFGYQFVGGGTAYFQTLYFSAEQLDKLSLKYFSIYRYSNNLIVNASGYTTKPNAQASAVLLISTDRTKLLGDQRDADIEMVKSISPDQSGYFGVGFSTENKEFFDTVSSGTILYATMCILAQGNNYYTYSAYFDPIRYKWVYTSAGPISEILHDTVP